MTLKEFFDAYEGIWIEDTSITNDATRDQCVDLFQRYNQKVISGPQTNGNAYQYFTTYPTDFYDKIVNTPTIAPKLGDVIIWDQSYGGFGHIAVCTDIADLNSFTSFDQNDPLKSPCHYQPHNYTKVLGWLRPKNLPQEVPVDPTKVKVDLGPTYGTLEVQAIVSKLDDNARDLVNANAKYDGLVQKWVQEWNLPTTATVVDVEAEMAKLMPAEEGLQKFRDAIEGVVGVFDNDLSLLQALQAVKSEITDKSNQIIELQKKLDDAKVPTGYKFSKSWSLFGGKYLIMMYTRG